MLGINIDDGRILGLNSKDLWVFVHCAPYMSRKAIQPEVLAEIISSTMNRKEDVANLIRKSCIHLAEIGILDEKRTGFIVDSTLISGKAPKIANSLDPSLNQRWSDKCTSYVTINNHVLKGEALNNFKLFVKSFGQHGDLKGGADSWWKLESNEPVDSQFLSEILKSAVESKKAREASAVTNPTSTAIFMQGWITKRRWEASESVKTFNNPLGLPVNPMSLR